MIFPLARAILSLPFLQRSCISSSPSPELQHVLTDKRHILPSELELALLAFKQASAELLSDLSKNVSTTDGFQNRVKQWEVMFSAAYLIRTPSWRQKVVRIGNVPGPKSGDFCQERWIPRFWRKCYFWSEAGGTALLLSTRSHSDHEIQWYWMSAIDRGAGVQEAVAIVWRRALGVWAESGPGNVSHLKHCDCGLKAQLNPTAATTKEWGAVE